MPEAKLTWREPNTAYRKLGELLVRTLLRRFAFLFACLLVAGVAGWHWWRAYMPILIGLGLTCFAGFLMEAVRTLWQVYCSTSHVREVRILAGGIEIRRGKEAPQLIPFAEVKFFGYDPPDSTLGAGVFSILFVEHKRPRSLACPAEITFEMLQANLPAGIELRKSPTHQDFGFEK